MKKKKDKLTRIPVYVSTRAVIRRGGEKGETYDTIIRKVFKKAGVR